MSAAASSSFTSETTTPTRSQKAVQQHLVRNLAALAMLLDEDAVEELILTLLRDNDMVGMLYHRSGISDIAEEVLEEVYDAGDLFEALNTNFWEEGRKYLASRLAAAAVERTIPSGGESRDTIQLVGGAAAGR